MQLSVLIGLGVCTCGPICWAAIAWEYLDNFHRYVLLFYSVLLQMQLSVLIGLGVCTCGPICWAAIA